jgi:hypothetical protein
MAKVTYAQMPGIKSVLESWWAVKGLPWALLQRLDTVAQVIATNADTFEKMRKKFIDDYAQKGEDGNPIIGDDGAVELADADQANEEWAKMVALEFDCPTLPADDLSANAEKLGITLGIMRTLKPIIAES